MLLQRQQLKAPQWRRRHGCSGSSGSSSGAAAAPPPRHRCCCRRRPTAAAFANEATAEATAAAELASSSSSAAAAAAATAAPAAANHNGAGGDDVDARWPLIPWAQQARELRARFCREYWLAGGLIYLSSGEPPHRNGADVYHRHRPESNFAYLVASDAALCAGGFAALLEPDSGRLTLIAPRADDDAALWWGGLPPLDDIAAHAGADAAAYASDLPAIVGAALKRSGGSSDSSSNGSSSGSSSGGGVLHVLPHQHPDVLAALLRVPHVAQHLPNQRQQAEALAAAVQAHGLALSTGFLEPALARARARKTPAEVACLLAASRGSAAGHLAAWAAAGEGVPEHALEAAFAHACATAQPPLRDVGYPPIVCAGQNASVLHYSRNDQPVGADELVLIDAGAEYRYYTADITRTFPGGGDRFTAAQRDVSEAVLSLQEHALARVAPGASWAEVQASTRRLLVGHLRDLGLVKRTTRASATTATTKTKADGEGGSSSSSTTTTSSTSSPTQSSHATSTSTPSDDALLAAGIDQVFMPHGLGHHLGLDVHDVSETGPIPRDLNPGMVITVEPGIYFARLLIERALAPGERSAALVDGDAARRLARLVGGVRTEDNVVVLDAAAAAAAAAGGGHFNLTAATGLPKAPGDVEASIRATRRQRRRR